MKNYQLFLASFYEPKKLAAFRLLPIGKVFQYVFLFVILSTIISFIRFLTGDLDLFGASQELVEYAETVGGLLYPMAFVLQLGISTFYLFIRVSFFGLVGLGLLKLLKRRGEYRHMWRTSAISITVPILISLGLDSARLANEFNFFITAAIHIVYLAMAATHYPKQPQAKASRA